jgi:hypothetical protein
MSEENLHEKWVPDVAEREAPETPDQEWVPGHTDSEGAPDQEWLPEHATFAGMERLSKHEYRCEFCSGKVPATRPAVEEHQATHA